MKNHKKHLDTLEALADAAVTVELEEGVSTKESRAAGSRYQALVADRLAEMRRAEHWHGWAEPKIENAGRSARRWWRWRATRWSRSTPGSSTRTRRSASLTAS